MECQLLHQASGLSGFTGFGQGAWAMRMQIVEDNPEHGRRGGALIDQHCIGCAKSRWVRRSVAAMGRQPAWGSQWMKRLRVPARLYA
jgi:hypothetical protein